MDSSPLKVQNYAQESLTAYISPSLPSKKIINEQILNLQWWALES